MTRFCPPRVSLSRSILCWRTLAAPASSATIDQLKQLSDLHQQGVLTDAEFTAAKAKLLGT